jgi:hypothetical protein
MSKYSILFEADEYHEIGAFRFPVYHDFTPGENKRWDKLNKEHAGSTYRSMQLAQRIARDHKIKASDALKILSNISADENQDYLFEYAEEVQALSDGVLNAEEQKANFVTLFMQIRGEACMPQTGWVKTKDWTSEDTDEMPGALIRDIYEFIMWERNGWPSEGKEPEPNPTPRSTKKTSTSKNA